MLKTFPLQILSMNMNLCIHFKIAVQTYEQLYMVILLYTKYNKCTSNNLINWPKLNAHFG